MCGICGIVNIDRNPVNETLLKDMTELMRHRGPDDHGIYNYKYMGLGARRLSIIDLSTGHQPMSNEDGTVWIAQNGEIYNYRELKRETELKGHIYRTKSDTEVIVHLYEEYGEEFAEKLNGMFSIALWDKKEEKLLLARDRVGIKPLYYYFDDHKLVFASEIKSILADKSIKRRISMTALNQYLSYGFIPAPLTMLEGIKKLPPGHMLVYKHEKQKIVSYWNINYAEAARVSHDEYLARFSEIMKRSVNRHLISDVPLGVFLSGGIDSSIIVAVASKLVEEPLNTFSIAFEDKTYNESRFVRLVANRFNTRHHELMIKADAMQVLPKLIQFMDEPVGDPCVLATYHLSMFARQYVTVALSGDGGDELFAGYDRYRREKFISWFCRIPQWMQSKGLAFADKIPHWRSKVELIKRSAALPLEGRYKYWTEIISEDVKRQLMEDYNLDSPDLVKNYFTDSDPAGSINKMLFVDFKTYLPDDLLLKVDQMSMAHSLEVRVPFLDQEVIDFAAGLPLDFKLRGFTTAKYLLRKYVEKTLPKEVYKRGKHGFNLPVDSWFRNEMKEFAYQILLDPAVYENGVFSRKGLEQFLFQHQQGKNYGSGIWALIIFELWRRQYVNA